MALLFSPLVAGRRTLANRLVLPPMATSWAGDDGLPTARHAAHYGQYVAAGVGLIIIEHTYVHPEGKAGEGQLGLAGGGLDAWEDLARAATGGESAVVVQITHAGGTTTPEVAGRVVGPTAVLHPRGRVVPEQLGRGEIEALVDAFAAAARTACRAGFDGVEVHGAHGYLLNQFLSPLTNRRRDEYGRDVEGRARLPLEVVRAVRDAVGTGALVLYRLGADDLVPGGLTLAEAARVSGWLARAGADIIDISGGMGGYPRGDGTTPLSVDGVEVEPMYLLPLASVIREAAGVPVIYTGGVTDPAVAEMVLVSGRCDLVGVGRAQLADPGWATAARAALDASRPENGEGV